MDTYVLAEQQQGDLDPGPRLRGSGVERLCAATGTLKPTAEMIRFVVSPEGAVVADLKRRLPGRGVWVTVTRQDLRAAVAKKAVARRFRRDVRVPRDLVEATEQLLERAALDALAITRKAGHVAAGFAKVETAIARGNIAALLHAAGA